MISINHIIKDIQVYPIKINSGEDLTNSAPVACPIAVYPDYREKRTLWRDDYGPMLVVIDTASGCSGYGYTSMGGPICAVMIEWHLKKLLIGESVSNHNKLHEIMLRATYHQGRDGYLMHAISALDLALWDIRAKIADQSVCDLLGGSIHNQMPCYLTGYNANKAIDDSMWGIKWPIKRGPASGRQGLQENIQDITELRQTIGPEINIMLDCWMGLDVSYTVTLINELKPFNIRWIEEPLLPGDISGYRELKKRIDGDIWITCGEHESLIRGAKPFLEENLVNVWQADVTWAGGITEMRKISALAEANNIYLIPHCNDLPWAAQFCFSIPNCPYIEWYDCTAETKPLAKPLYTSDMSYTKGMLTLGNEPGFGVNINWDIVSDKLDHRFRKDIAPAHAAGI